MSKVAKLTTVAAVVFGFTGLTTAQGDTSAPTRAQVQAELQSARASGQMTALHGEDSGSGWLSSGSARAAQSVQAPRGRVSAADGGLAAALVREDSGSAYLSANAPSSRLTRAEVLAELAAARSGGELHALVGEDSGAAFLARQRAWVAALYAGPNIGTRQQADTPPVG